MNFRRCIHLEIGYDLDGAQRMGSRQIKEILIHETKKTIHFEK
jgi:hypothetical protein